jgi:peptidylprolyl isomerase
MKRAPIEDVPVRRLLVLLFCLGLLVSGCGGDDDTPDVDIKVNKPGQAGPFQFPTVSSSELGTDPKIVSSTDPPDNSVLKILKEGDGEKIKAGDVIAADYRGQVWEPSGAELPPFVNTFDSGVLWVGSIDSVIPAWNKKLPGVRVGSRVLLVATPDDAFGIDPPDGQPILPNDTLMFVIDVLDAYPRDTGPTGTKVTPGSNAKLPKVTGVADPRITIPAGDPPSELLTALLVRGKGEKVPDKAWVSVQYTAVVWRTGKVFDSTWQRKGGPVPLASRLAVRGTPLNGKPGGGVIEGLLKGLVGQTVGSRVLLVVPPGQGYGAAGLPDKGVRGDDTVVFVIDILGSYRSGERPGA